jgi:hypothetical protein
MPEIVRYGLTGTGIDGNGGPASVLVEHNVSTDGSELRIELLVPSFPSQVATQDRTYQDGEFSKDVSADQIRIDAPLGMDLQSESGVAITLFLPQVPPSLADGQEQTATGAAVFTSAPPQGEAAKIFAVSLEGTISS